MTLAPVAANDHFTVTTGAQTTLTGHLGADNGAGVDRDPEGGPLGWVLGPLNAQGDGYSYLGASFSNGELGFLHVVQSGYVTMPIWVTTTYMTTAAGGQVALNTNGTFTYTAAPGWSGADSFTYTLVDTTYATTTATVTIGATEPPKVVVPPPAPIEAPTQIDGTQAADVLAGTDAADTIYALAGNDRIAAGAGADHVVAGLGNDVVLGDAGADRLLGGEGNDRISGGNDNDRVQGDAGADGLSGGSGLDILDGGADNDKLSGGNGNDTLRGGSGDDSLTGGSGIDALTGGAGADVFVLSTASSRNADRIADFGTGDKLGLSAGALGLLPGALPADWFADEGAADSGHARIVQSADGLRLSFDVDGSAATADRLMATFAAPVDLTADSFVLL